MQNKFFLGVDGGGTKTNVVCVDEAGVVKGMGQVGPTNLTSTTVGAASFNLREGLRQATESLPTQREISCMVMGLAGMDSQEEHDSAIEIFSTTARSFGVDKVVLVNDSEIALENGTQSSEAIVLLAGTGSNCRGKNAQGEVAVAGGKDYLLSDQGSGYDIGRQVLYAVVKSYDGRSQETMLEKLVCQYFHIESIAALKGAVYQPPLIKPEIAKISLLCFQAAKEGDAVATSILQHASTELASHVTTVATKLQLLKVEFDLVLAGSIATDQVMRDLLCPQIKQVCSYCNMIVPEKPPVWGAVAMAMMSAA